MAIMQRLRGVSQAVEPERLEGEYGQLLVEGEAFEVGFRAFRDVFVFTDRRLVLINVQGVRGKKHEYLSIPYSKITKYSIESAGSFDLDAELRLWVGSDPQPIKREFSKQVSVYDLQQILASYIR